MLVLGYVDATTAGMPRITVPPFNTGHLGFVPGTPVRISLVGAPSHERRCELVVTPFEQDTRYLAVVEATMRDEPGVVARLVKAVAALGINIEVQESSSINLLDHHFVSLIVDMSESSMSTRTEFSSPTSIQPSPTAVRRVYREYDSVFPFRDLRFVRLFESIMAHCADVIVWKEVSGEYFPDINIRPYWDRPMAKSVVRQLATGAGKLHVEFYIPVEIMHRVKQVVGNGPQLPYLLLSDTTTRMLHVFFLHPAATEKLFHLGVFHDDVPGALATILALLRDADFNILTSLMRKEGKGRSVWEAVLEYKGTAQVPASESRAAHSPITQGELQWLCNEIVTAHARTGGKVIDCDIKLAPPKYPIRPSDAPVVSPVAISELLGSSVGTIPEPIDGVAELVRQRREGLAEHKLDKDVVRKSDHLLSLIADGDKEDEPPGIFLSYPRLACEHGEALFQSLVARGYRADRYQEPDGEVIVDEVIRKIEGSDYFIGIWHHNEEPRNGKRTRNISPWMLFEYGIARAAEKPAIVVHSDKLHPSIWRRVDPGVSNPEYSDLHFKSKTLGTILTYCERHFR
jgi:predicted amino acid-binding ACT domain protein